MPKDSLEATFTEFANFLQKPKQKDIASRINEDEARLDIYYNNVLAAKIEALKASYPATLNIVGEEFFWQFAKLYCQDHPANSGNLDDYGNDFANFIAKNSKLHQLSYLADIASFEHHINQIDKKIDQKNHIDLNNSDEATLIELKLSLKDNLVIIESDYPILSLYLFAMNKIQEEPNFANKETVIIYKDGFDIRFFAIAEAEYELMQIILKHDNFFKAFASFNSKQTEIFPEFINKYLFCFQEKHS